MLLFLAAANAQAGWVYVIASALLGITIAGIIAPPFVLRRVSVSRELPPAVTVGDTVQVRLGITNTGLISKGPFWGKDSLLGDTPFVVDRVPAKRTSTIEYEGVANRRGVYRDASIRLETGAPFGAATARRLVKAKTNLIVHPSWSPLSSLPVLEAASTPNEAFHERPKRGAGMEFFGLREYRPGDSLRHVHWRSTARGGRILVREFEEHPASRLTVIIDAAQKVGAEPKTTFETAVSAAASIVMYALDSGHPVQLSCAHPLGTRRLVEPGKVDALDWLAEQEAVGGPNIADTTRGEMFEITRRSTTVLISPTTVEAARAIPEAVAIAQERSSRVLVVLISARDFAKDGRVLNAADESRLVEELAGSRAVAYLVTGDRSLVDCLKEPVYA
ncbi:MAG TPA: DUF58 domain-containing protein [Actinomycetota bacterium]|nr:DUF58 domain-containing protein [Actinomycetota bacterium]